jgi:hypothetical protein
VGLDRLVAEHELLGDLAVGPPAGDQLGDLAHRLVAPPDL